MEARLDRQASTLALAFEDSDELAGFAAELLEREAFMVQLAEELPIGTRLAVTLAWSGAFEHRLEAEVMHRFDTVTGAYGTACQLVDWSGQRAEQLRAALSGLGRGAGGEAASPDRPSAPDETEAGDGESDGAAPAETETLGISALHRIREMNVSERTRLAMRASRQERRILLRDTSAQVLLGLVSNPRLEAKEVLQVVRTTHVTGAVLERVARDPRWNKNREVLAVVAGNPKAPSPLAVRLMPALRTGDLRRMAKISGGLRENVRRAALKEYLSRTSKR